MRIYCWLEPDQKVYVGEIVTERCPTCGHKQDRVMRAIPHKADEPVELSMMETYLDSADQVAAKEIALTLEGPS